MNRIKYLIPDEVSSGIYKLTSSDGHYYIGSSCNLTARFRNHKKALEVQRHPNKFIQNVYNKTNGAWTFELLEACHREQLPVVENNYLLEHFSREECMNICTKAGWYPGVSGPKPWVKGSIRGVKRGPYRKRTLAHCQAISAGKKGVPHGPMSLEARIKLSNTLKGRKLSEEHKAKLRAAKLGKTPWNKGKQLTPEHIRKRQLSRYQCT